jgi:hypothetical protein
LRWNRPDDHRFQKTIGGNKFPCNTVEYHVKKSLHYRT